MSLARFAPGTAEGGLELRPGQVMTSWNALAEEMACRERGRRMIPSLGKVRRAAAFLEKAGEATVCATGRPAYTGLVITLERWALYAGEVEHAADVSTDLATDRLPEERQDHKKEYGSAGSSVRQTPRRHPLLFEVERWKRQAEEGRREVLEVRRREREGPDGA
jgi:hypothetical protein